MKVEPGPHRPSALGITEPKLWGVYVGEGCVTGEDPLEWLSVEAHAHVGDDPWRGWICVADRRRVITQRGNPTHLLLHEVAHIICNTTKHDRRWRDEVTRLGARREAKRYERKK